MVLRVHLTGFGEFAGMPENPSGMLVASLPAFVANHHPDLLSFVAIDDALALEVSTVAVDECLESMFAKSRHHHHPSDIHLFIHFGVLGGSRQFQLERTGVNEAEFRIPDQQNFQPRNSTIVPDAPLTLQSTLSVEALCGKVSSGASVVVSDDAGRYVCNWTYYQSLYHSRQSQSLGHRHHSLFVHVPEFSVVDQNTQMMFAVSMMEALIELQRSGQLTTVELPVIETGFSMSALVSQPSVVPVVPPSSLAVPVVVQSSISS